MTPKNYEALDSAVILYALSIIAFIAGALVFTTIPDAQLAILASIASGILGTIVGAYAGYRWATSKQAADTIRDMARATPLVQPVVVEQPADQPIPVEETRP